MKHPAITVVNIKEEESQIMDKNSHFKVYMERPQKLVGVIVKPNGKPRNSLHFRVYKYTAGYDLNI